MKKVLVSCKYYFKERRRFFATERHKVFYPLGIICSVAILPFLIGLFLRNLKIIFPERNFLYIVFFCCIVLTFNAIDQSFCRLQNARDMRILSILGFSRGEYVCLKEWTLSLEINASAFFLNLGFWGASGFSVSLIQRIFLSLLLMVTVILGFLFRIYLLIFLNLIKKHISSFVLGILIKLLSILPFFFLIVCGFFHLYLILKIALSIGMFILVLLCLFMSKEWFVQDLSIFAKDFLERGKN
ncbi:MAG: hypothetical protein LBS28_04995 [Streptococcaceae bacterium]|jgi:hypothetical protein|nr:hypothetical protein [Streptococcaceae bacterium]